MAGLGRTGRQLLVRKEVRSGQKAGAAEQQPRRSRRSRRRRLSAVHVRLTSVRVLTGVQHY